MRTAVSRPLPLERMAAATLLASFTGPDVPDWMDRRVEDGLGGVCLYGSNRMRGADDIGRVAARLRASRHGLLVALDEEGGAVTRLEATTGSSLPGNAALGAIDDPAATRQIALALGELLAEVGVDLDLAPCADVNVDAANPVIGVRSFSADPVIVSRHVAAFVDGLQSAGVAACAKHFPGHGATTVDSHLALPQVDAPVEVLAWRELAPFEAAIGAGVAAIMTAHLRVPALDPDHPATVSRAILTGVLRDRLGFTGAVVTDALDMHGIGGPPSIPANVVRSLAAGADLVCIGPDATDGLVGACIDAVVGAVGSAALDDGRLADAAGRVAALMPDATWPHRGQDRRSLGVAAAQRALGIEGTLPIPLIGAHVVELRRAMMIAAGDVPWGVAGSLGDVDPTSTSERLGDVDGVPGALARAEGRGLVVVVRDPQCDQTTAGLLAGLVDARPDAVVVDMGWPADSPVVPPDGARVTTYGPSRASGDAVARLLVGVDAVLIHPVSQHLGRNASG
ncbi:MAG: glycoside hydrolase family 3 protein [Acidimicrobiales bacterium]